MSRRLKGIIEDEETGMIAKSKERRIRSKGLLGG